jgi:pyruvate ferredoxin oxidoreductase alpha subunit
VGETVSMAVEKLRSQGKPVGQVKIRLWRPFPIEEFREAVRNVKRIIVIDRAVSFGGQGGPVAAEIRSVLYDEENRPSVTNFICGLAGRDVTPDNYIDIYEKSLKITGDKSKEEDYVLYGVRE